MFLQLHVILFTGKGEGLPLEAGVSIFGGREGGLPSEAEGLPWEAGGLPFEQGIACRVCIQGV